MMVVNEVGEGSKWKMGGEEEDKRFTAQVADRGRSRRWIWMDMIL